MTHSGSLIKHNDLTGTIVKSFKWMNAQIKALLGSFHFEVTGVDITRTVYVKDHGIEMKGFFC